MVEEQEVELILDQLILEDEQKEQEQEKKIISLHDRVNEIKEITGYEFNDPILLQQAFTHHSYEESCSYERLEYVGDGVLSFGMAKDHYFMYPDLDPGRLTRLRAANVDTEKLARVAVTHELYKFLRHKLPQLAVQIKEFKNAMEEYPVHSSGLIEAPKVLADIVESLVGAIYIDSNSSIDTTWKVVQNLLQPTIGPENLNLHPVTMLFEICQKNRLEVNIRDLWRDTGEIEFVVDGEFVGRAKYGAKRSIAYNRAAQMAYHQIMKKLDTDNTSPGR